jgi:hypothetical protein
VLSSASDPSASTSWFGSNFALRFSAAAPRPKVTETSEKTRTRSAGVKYAITIFFRRNQTLRFTRAPGPKATQSCA